jgi:ATP-dependent Clp protease ATP-binding subunit ClpA
MHREAVDTEHMLLSLIRESEVAANPQGTAIQALARCGVDLNTLRAAVLSQLRPGDFAGQERELPFSKNAKTVLEHAFTEARTLGHAHMGTEHVLLGLLREDSGVAAQTLKAQGLTMPGLRAAIEGIGGHKTGEIEIDGANLVVTDPSVIRDHPLEPTDEIDAPGQHPAAALLAMLVLLLEKQPETARLFAEQGITVETLRELAKKAKG